MFWMANSLYHNIHLPPWVAFPPLFGRIASALLRHARHLSAGLHLHPHLPVPTFVIGDPSSFPQPNKTGENRKEKVIPDSIS